ncbi:hypothetical protein J7E70_30005 [Variovorax paradoxus]|nr:hypothetical protein [Variovorax paradoxus]MBT2304658.1 hypothetical protein [Variovorax paradoxus]
MVEKIDKALRPPLERRLAKHQREIEKTSKQLADLERDPQSQCAPADER